MVKQTKTFKKGNVTKKALSAILAASMVMTSSSFVMAAPVEVEDVTVEVAAVDEVETIEENVGVASRTLKLSGTFTFAADVVVEDDMTQAEAFGKLQNTVVPRIITKADGSIENDNNTKLSEYINDEAHHVVTITDAENKTVELTQDNMPTKAGQYTVSVTGNECVDGEGNVAVGTTTAVLNIKHDVTNTTITTTFKNASGTYVEGLKLGAVFTGAEIKPEIKLKDKNGKELKAGTDYTILGYGNNINAASANAGDTAPYVEVRFNDPYQQRGDVKYTFTIVEAHLVLNETNTTVTIENDKTVYNADVQQPVVKVMYKPEGSQTSIELKKDVDYTVTVKNSDESQEVKNPKNAGTYKVLIKGINNYKDLNRENKNFDIKKDYQIKKQAFNNTTVTVETPNVTYMGDSVTAAIYVLKDAVSGKKLDPSEYAIWYYDDSKQGYVNKPVATKPGTYAIKFVSNKRNYDAGEIKTNYTIVEVGDSLQGMLSKKEVTLGTSTKGVAVVEGTGNQYTYDKDGTVPATVKIGSRTFYADGRSPEGNNDDTDARYDVEFPNLEDCKNVGTYTIQLKGKGEWAGQTATIGYKVVPKKLDEDELTVLAGTDVKVYKDHDGNVTVDFAEKLADDCGHDEEYKLVQDKDYTYKLRKVNDKYDIEVSYKGNYTGKSIKTGVEVTLLTSNKLPLTVESISAEVTGDYLYTGAPIKPSKENIVLKENGRTLVYGIDYKLADVNPYGLAGSNIKVGQGTVKVTGLGSYSGDRVITFDIKAGETVKDSYVLDTTNLKAVYETGTNFNPANDLMVKTTSGKVLNPTTEYEVKYYRNGKEVSADVAKTAGTYTVEVTVKETKTVLTAAYRVATSLSKATNVKDIANQAFTGSAVEPEVTVVKNATNVELVKGTDYVVSYTNNVKQGTATVTVEGIGDYYGTITKNFKIAGQAEQSIAVLAAQARDIQKRTLNSKSTVVKFEADKAPKTAVTYTSSDENVVKVDETGKITYTGLGEATITIKAAETAEYKAAEATMTVKVGLAKPSFTPFSKNDAFTLTSSTVKGAEKFEVEYATKKDFSNSKTKTFATTSAGKIRQVKVSASDKKTYYVRVRAISGTTKSAWSGVKTVATK